MLEENVGFFKEPEFEMISTLIDSDWADTHMELVSQGDPDEDIFIALLVAYGQAIMEKLVSGFDSRVAVRFMGKNGSTIHFVLQDDNVDQIKCMLSTPSPIGLVSTRNLVRGRPYHSGQSMSTM